MVGRVYKVSVVIPVYNVEQYLAECIESILAQSIGFKQNIQIVLVNDGSSDESGAICQKYADTYPANVLYLEQKNSGVSAARNNGLKKAKGEFISLIDSDDKVAPDYFENLIKILEENTSIPFAAARVKFFGIKNEYHVADDKFIESRVIDLDTTPNIITSLVPTVLFRKSALKGIVFDTEMTHNEDAKFADTVLLKGGVYRYGVVREALYYYRKRLEATSASDNATERHSFYTSTQRYADFLMNAGKYTKDGKAPKFIQYHALYHYRWRITQTKKPDILTPAEWELYKEAVVNGIRALDDETIIKGSVNTNLRHKMTLLYVKYSGDKKRVRQAINADKNLRSVLFDEISLSISTINYTKKDGIAIEGSTPFCELSVFNSALEFSLDGKRLKHSPTESTAYIFDDTYTDKVGFSVQVPEGRAGNLVAKVTNRDGTSKQLELVFTITSRISMRQNDYRVLKGKILLLPSRNSLKITSFSLHKIIKREVLFFFQNLVKNKYKVERNVLKTIAVEFVRVVALLHINRKPSGVWLFSDRSISGGDNSEVLFRYVSDQSNPIVKPIFTINKDTPAYSQLKAQGYKVVPFKSLRHLYLSIIAEVILPSHMDMMYLYPWFGVWQKYCGLIQYDIAHTQHGIVLNDLSNYISKQKKNASIFLSAGKWEQKHLTNGSYGYTKDQVPVTGLPRYDELIDTSETQPEKIISLHPTWRSWLSGDATDGKRAYRDTFKESDYFKFYQRLITDMRIIEALERNNYILKYYIHPNHVANQGDFSVNSERIRMMDFPYNYSQIFSESKLFVTDYSNTLFDFAYLRKPVIHSQFDFNEFFSKHGSVSKQLFNYDTEGFGPVCYDYESTINTIVSYLDTSTGLDKKYQDRVNKFFTYSDAHNSERAYSAIYEAFIENRSV